MLPLGSCADEGLGRLRGVLALRDAREPSALDAARGAQLLIGAKVLAQQPGRLAPRNLARKLQRDPPPVRGLRNLGRSGRRRMLANASLFNFAEARAGIISIGPVRPGGGREGGNNEAIAKVSPR